MKTRMLLCIAVMLLFLNAANVKTTSLREAVKQKLVSVETKGKGGFTGDVLTVTVKNLSGRRLNLQLEAGMKFHPDDRGMQDIVVTGEQLFALEPNTTKVLDVNGMCCLARNSSPSPGTNFTMGELGDSSLVRIARYIDKHKLYASHEAQEGVWTISDKIRTESIDFLDPENSGLMEEVLEITRAPKPEYVINYEWNPLIPFTGNAASVKGVFRCKITKQHELTMALYDSNGKAFDESKVMGPPMPGNYTFGFEFNVYNFPKGTYYAKVKVASKTMAEVKIVL